MHIYSTHYRSKAFVIYCDRINIVITLRATYKKMFEKINTIKVEYLGFS